MFKKIIASSIILTATLWISYADNVEVDCSTNPVFAEYSCNQCFTGWAKGQWEYVGFMSDLWVNETTNSKLLYKEVQKMPEMINLDESKVAWSQVPSSEDFWEYTQDLETIHDEDLQGYVLTPGSSVTWIKSRVDAAYKLDRNEVIKEGNIGLLVYTITSGNIMDDGEITTDFSEHSECVLYTSWDEKKVTPPTTLPNTGPAEYFLLLILAMVLGFWIVKFKNSKA